MENSFPVHHFTLGMNAKPIAFKVFDNFIDPDKNSINKDNRSKSNSKPNIYDAMDYLRTLSLKPKELKETDKPSLTSSIDSVTGDEIRRLQKKTKTKLLSIIDSSMSLKCNSVKYFFSSPSTALTKTKTISLPIWFKKRKYSLNTNEERVNNESVVPVVKTKVIKLEWSIETEMVYITPDLFYQSNRTLSIDSKNVIFYLFGQEQWNELEFAINCVKGITIFSNQSFIKFTLKASLLTDLQHIFDDIDRSSLSFQITLLPKKVTQMKEVLIIFTKNPISTNDVTVLKTIFGEEKVVYNTVEKESQEVLANLFGNLPRIRENLSNFHITWSTFTKDTHRTTPDVSTPGKSPLVTSKKSPMIPCKSSSSIVKLMPPLLNHIPNLVLHPSSPAVSMSSCSKPAATNTVICHQNPSFLGNHIVIATALTPNRIDPYPNLFNRMINDSSSSIGQLTVMTCPVASPNNFSFSLSTANNGGLQVNNFANIYQRQQQNHSLPVDFHNGAPPTTNASAAITDRMTSAVQLSFVNGRNLENIFSTFNYAPSPDYNVLIHGSDLICLNYGQYLNDNIINFYLNYIRYEKCTEDQRQCSHLFNVFFNTKLQGAATPIFVDPPEVRHARVAKWTKKVDIFDKDFIIVPINEAQHWFLAIVCFPWMAGMISYDTLFAPVVTSGTGSYTPQQPMLEIPHNDSEFATKVRVERVRKLQQEKGVDPKPCILLFDSLQHQSRAPNVRLIREYLRTEWDAKRLERDGPLVFDKNTIRGFNPQVPQQSNTIDCGIYVLHYVEMFFQHPLSLYTKEYFQSSLIEWFDKKTCETKREFIQKLLLKKGEVQQQQLLQQQQQLEQQQQLDQLLQQQQQQLQQQQQQEQSNSDKDDNTAEELSSPKVSLDDSGPDLQIL